MEDIDKKLDFNKFQITAKKLITLTEEIDNTVSDLVNSVSHLVGERVYIKAALFPSHKTIKNVKHWWNTRQIVNTIHESKFGTINGFSVDLITGELTAEIKLCYLNDATKFCGTPKQIPFNTDMISFPSDADVEKHMKNRKLMRKLKI